MIYPGDWVKFTEEELDYWKANDEAIYNKKAYCIGIVNSVSGRFFTVSWFIALPGNIPQIPLIYTHIYTKGEFYSLFDVISLNYKFEREMSDMAFNFRMFPPSIHQCMEDLVHIQEVDDMRMKNIYV